MSDVRLIDISDDEGHYYCRVYTVEYEGKQYRLEEWATDNASGVEVYDEDGKALYDDDPLPENVMESFQPIVSDYDARYRAEVQPVIDRIKEEIFGGSD